MGFQISELWQGPMDVVSTITDSPLQREAQLLRQSITAGFNDQVEFAKSNPILAGIEGAAGLAIGAATFLGRRYWIPCALATTALGLVSSGNTLQRIGITARAMGDAWGHPNNFQQDEFAVSSSLRGSVTNSPLRGISSWLLDSPTPTEKAMTFKPMELALTQKPYSALLKSETVAEYLKPKP